MQLDAEACYRALITRDVRFDGRFFVGVRTTGIYCRSICPARTPKRANVSFYPSAAAAQEAGFRPCLRCRPETAPDSGAWRGTSSTVSRALALIELGALDQGDVDTLATRLGVGERQLRRLFRQHLGASPIAVAQTRRVLLAKQLIHETQLRMTDVALGAGFGSLRRFNEVFQQLFNRAPATLRRCRIAGVATASSCDVTVLLRYRPPYDWAAVLSYLRGRAIPGVEWVTADRYSRSIEIDGMQGTVSVTAAPGHALSARIRLARLSALPGIIARLRRVFDLAADPQAIGRHLMQDPRLALLIKRRPGLRVPGAWDGFELAVRAVLGQQITVAAATGLAGKLVAAYGTPLTVAGSDEPGLTHVFPRPSAVCSANFAALGMPSARALALHSLAVAATADPHLFSTRQDLGDAVAQLRALPGIGEWTAQYIAMRQLHEPDALPAADVGLMRALADTQGRRPNVRQLLALAERWRPWRAYAAHHLWASHQPPGSLSSPRYSSPSNRNSFVAEFRRVQACNIRSG